MVLLNSIPSSSTANASAAILVPHLSSERPGMFPITPNSTWGASRAVKLSSERMAMGLRCSARRRLRNEEEEEEGAEYGYNEEIAMLESYSRSARGEALIVHASIDGEEVEVVIFKGFSSSLSYKTSSDPARSILPARAIVKFIDRVEGPFDPSNIHYLQKQIPWEEFKTTLSPI